jgi:hypothetical protein
MIIAPIEITWGSASLKPDQPFTFGGPHFRFSVPHTKGGPDIVVQTCGVAGGCTPGTALDLSIAVYDLQHGKVKYSGTDYVTGPGPGHANVTAVFRAAEPFILPAVTQLPLYVQRPVTFSGEFIYPKGPVGVPLTLADDVSASTTYTFVPISGGSRWLLVGARFDIRWTPAL